MSDEAPPKQERSAEEVRNDIVEQIAALYAENQEYPSQIGITFEKALRRFLELSDLIDEIPEGDDERLEEVEKQLTDIKELIDELARVYAAEQEQRKIRGMAASIAGIEGEEMAKKIVVPGNSIDNPS